MKKIKAIGLFGLLLLGNIYPQTLFTLEISGIEENGGDIFVSLFNSEKAYKNKQIFQSFVLEPKSSLLNTQLSIPDGEYLISAYQDTDGNGKLRTNIIGIPREPIAISHYSGKGFPGNFNRHKVIINEHNKTFQLIMIEL